MPHSWGLITGQIARPPTRVLVSGDRSLYYVFDRLRTTLRCVGALLRCSNTCYSLSHYLDPTSFRTRTHRYTLHTCVGISEICIYALVSCTTNPEICSVTEAIYKRLHARTTQRTHARTHARMERRLFQNYRHACVCMQIRFLICIHAREASSMYKPRARVYANLICIHAREASSMYKPRARVYANLICIHAREASCTHARHAFMQITMHVLVRRIWFRSTTCTCVLMETFERLGETVQLCNVYWISIKRMR